AVDAPGGEDDRKEICAARKRELGSSPALVAARVCHSPAGRWRGSPRDSGVARPRLALDHAALHANRHRATDGRVRQGSPPCLKRPLKTWKHPIVRAIYPLRSTANNSY